MNKRDFEKLSPRQLQELIRDISPNKTQPETLDTSGLFGPVPQLGECDQCGMDTGQLVLARLTIQYAGFEFCCACCFEEWMDANQDRQSSRGEKETTEP
jgi:hypothetical protein